MRNGQIHHESWSFPHSSLSNRTTRPKITKDIKTVTKSISDLGLGLQEFYLRLGRGKQERHTKEKTGTEPFSPSWSTKSVRAGISHTPITLHLSLSTENICRLTDHDIARPRFHFSYLLCHVTCDFSIIPPSLNSNKATFTMESKRAMSYVIYATHKCYTQHIWCIHLCICLW